ncbi:MAG: hypothetical protein O7C61_02540, partial [SAR324 cluster bacterium]|nr:hypothetical protein [SAR324 cluster bacterium]
MWSKLEQPQFLGHIWSMFGASTREGERRLQCIRGKMMEEMPANGEGVGTSEGWSLLMKLAEEHRNRNLIYRGEPAIDWKLLPKIGRETARRNLKFTRR